MNFQSELKAYLAECKARGGDVAVDVYGTVLLYSGVSLTKRGEFMMSIDLIDESHSEFPISLHIFRKEADRLPQIRRVGDVLRMHRVDMQVSEASDPAGFLCLVVCGS